MINSKTFIWLYRRGLICSPVHGGDDTGEYMLGYPVDGVQYVFDDAGDIEEDGDTDFMIGSIECLSHILERHHSTAKLIYDSIQTKFKTKDIWVRVGAGPQLGLMYGYKDGIIGMLSLDFISVEERNKIIEELNSLLSDQDGIEPIIDESPSFYVNSTEMNSYFKNTVYPNVEIIMYDDSYYDGEEDDEED